MTRIRPGDIRRHAAESGHLATSAKSRPVLSVFGSLARVGPSLGGTAPIPRLLGLTGSMKQGKVIIVALALLALAAPAAAAANAARGRVLLDRSFGSAGVLIKPDFGEQRIALDGYGRVLTADGSSDGFQIVRYLPSGRPDTRFGLNCIAEIPLRTDWGEVVTAIRVQPDGKILVAGSYVAELGEGEYQGTAVLARLEADGSIDEGFGGFGGFRERPGLIATRGIDAMLVQRGKIVAAGGNGHGYVA